ncbi:hypothetical protein B0T25DRAFT_550644 [Lasiosphaeria hispida]|uniref:Uncharacterized protein n=1 Tax=Lasiosphaeria hispida TaxID=260671 RepID=A0AAJ0HAA4_9PEZI|nr:hypothetical protein B0T25DRAFT_550644 [Lasiosphaeria hispida]
MEKPAKGPKTEVVPADKTWPPEPTPMGKHGVSLYFGIITDVACILAAFPFLVLAGAAARFDGRVAPPDEWYMVYLAMNAAVTIFPIAYTAIVARTIKALATWKLERGTTLGLLEQLLASRSLVGALQILWSLRVVNVVGLLLVTVAVISPIGGQASLQMLRIRDVPDISQAEIAYLTTLKDGSSIFGFSPGYVIEAVPAMNTMYGASLTAPASVKNSTMDLWGNLKIPCLSRLATPADGSGWQDVPPDPLLEKYSSLIGIPARGLSRDTNTSYSLETSYFDLDCYKMINGTAADCNVKNDTASIATNNTKPDYYCYPGSTFALGIDAMLEQSYGGPWGYVNDTGRDFPQRTLRFQSMSLPALSVAYCRISTAYVEAAVDCTGLACAVARMRPSQLLHPDPRLVPFEFTYYFNSFSGQWALTNKPASGSTRGSQLTEFFLNDPLLPLANTYRRLVGLYAVSPADMSVRLGQVLNSYYLASLDPDGITGMSSGSGAPTTTVNGDGSVVDGSFRNITAPSTVSVNRVLYVCQWGWWAVFVLACLVMLAVACVGAALNRRTAGPDVLGYVSTLTRDSPYVAVPEGGSAMDGSDRARLLRELRVQMRDVRPDEDVGYLAFTSCQGRDEARLRVVKRVYK